MTASPVYGIRFDANDVGLRRPPPCATMRNQMTSLINTRAHLTDFDTQRIGHVFTDTLVIGTGVAGCRAAIAAADFGQVTMLTKSRFEQSNTHYAQGGIASALAADDTAQSHMEDTLRVGCGMCDRPAVEMLVNEGPPAIEELIAWGMVIDREAGRLVFGREGGHSANRIVHAHGDQTGRELITTLRRRVEVTTNLRVFENCFLIDFVTVDDRCVGVIAFHPKYGHQIIWAKQTILASGGCGQLWRETTNPSVATGDGLAASFRAGATLCDLEMMQFHPTTLYVAGAGRALISEAVRGEGAYLVDRAGDRFMAKYHADGELAPRDVVSQAINTHLQETRSNCVYLDVRHVKGFGTRFPHIAEMCARFQIDVTADLIPVRPSAHYMIGGVDVDVNGRSSLDGLLCCGEAAYTGVHGANRLASNSLLEGLVFGKRAGETAGQTAATLNGAAHVRRVRHENALSDRTTLDLPDIRNSLRSVVWRNVGIVRHGDRLRETVEILDFWAHYTLDKTLEGVDGWETQNELTLAWLITASALERGESIGVHFRADAPQTAPASHYHLRVTRSEDGTRPVRVQVTG